MSDFMPRAARESAETRALCERLVPGGAALRLRVMAPRWAVVNECTRNAAQMVERYGGSVEYGWQLWELFPGVMIEAEFHAVWVAPRGDRQDVTPKEIPGVREILFIPDPSLEYRGRQIPSVRVALHEDPLLEELIQVKDDRFAALNRGSLADYHGPIRETPEMRSLRLRDEALEIELIEKYYGVAVMRQPLGH